MKTAQNVKSPLVYMPDRLPLGLTLTGAQLFAPAKKSNSQGLKTANNLYRMKGEDLTVLEQTTQLTH